MNRRDITLVLILLAVQLTLFQGLSLAIEQTPTRFYYPTGTSQLGELCRLAYTGMSETFYLHEGFLSHRRFV